MIRQCRVLWIVQVMKLASDWTGLDFVESVMSVRVRSTEDSDDNYYSAVDI